ncbi:UNVERIFIED_CONTAM: hypothetical protein GTU68_006564 [Idotea baltica]|nr:hypothetical protein [Idotea baltica]
MPREKLLKQGVQSLSDHELLSIILGSGNKKMSVFQISKKLLKLLDQSNLNFKIKELSSIKGVGIAKASLIIAALEFSKRRIISDEVKIEAPGDVYPLLSHLSNRKQEHFISISLNGANNPINLRIITIGLANSANIHSREVFTDIIKDRACSLIVAHNHPSGDLSPSNNDIAVTRNLKKSGDILGIPLLDHIIFSKKGYYSFKEHELI